MYKDGVPEQKEAIRMTLCEELCGSLRFCPVHGELLVPNSYFKIDGMLSKQKTELVPFDPFA